MTSTEMRLSQYLTGSNFHAFDAALPNGGQITAHHGKDRSTAKYYEKMQDGQFLISYRMPDGEYRRCEIAHDVLVTCTPTR